MRLVWMFALLAACGVDEQDYPTRRAAAECRTLEKCAQGQYESHFRNMDDCVDDVADDIDDVIDEWFDKCEYDPAEAKRCVSRVRGMSCAEWASGYGDRACDLVYDCTR